MLKNKKIEEIRKQVEETQKIMAKNIEKAIVRGKALEELKEKTQAIKGKSHHFAKGAVSLKRQLQWRNIQLTTLIVGILIGGMCGALGGASTVGIALYAGIGGIIFYFIARLASEIQQKLNPFSLKQWGHSPDKETKVNSAFKKFKGLFSMGKKKDFKPVEAAAREISTPNDDDAPLTEQEIADLEQVKQDMEAVKKLEALKAQQLIERGQLLEQATGKATELNQDTAKLTQTAHQVQRYEEAKDHHLNSILIGMGGVAIGAGYGFLMGYSWPLMVVFGVLAGSLTYGLSTFASKILEKVVSVGDWFKSFSTRQFSSSPQRVYHPYQAQSSFEQSKTIFMRFKAKPESVNVTPSDDVTVQHKRLRR